MRKMMDRLSNKFDSVSISRKISLIYSVFFIILSFALSSFMLINAYMYYNRVSRSELEQVAEKVVEYIENSGDTAQDKLDELNPNKNIKLVVTEKGNDPRQIMNGQGFPPPDFEMNVRNDTDRGSMRFKMGKFNNQHYLYTMRFARYDGKEYSVQVFRPQNTEIGILRIFAIIFLAINALAILVSLKIGRYISLKMLKPIREMTETAAKITAEDLSGRVILPKADDEFRALALTFNNMFDRLESSFEKQKQFVSDASHELRTPVSVIQGYANLIDRWGKSDEAVLDESIASIKSETEHISILIDQLLFLARDDKGTTVLNKEKINLWELASEAVSETEITNSAEDVVCTLAGEEGVCVCADSHLIKQTIRIIIENAIKYTKDKPCKIDVKIASEGNKALLSIADNGIGIPGEDIEHIFDRFFRGDKSRNKQIPGNGLGLSIAYSIVEKHGGRLWADSAAGEGSTFYIELESEK